MPIKLQILHAEDDENDLLLIHKAFARAGLKPVHTSPDGEDALNYLQGTGKYSDRKAYPYPDVLIIDLKMPRLTGFEIMEWLNSHPDHRIPIIVLSGSGQDQDVKRAYELGASCYLVKPASASELDEIMSAIKALWLRAQLPRKS